MGLTQIDGGDGLKKPIDLADNEKVRFGASQDLEIYHDGSNSYIADTGTGKLHIRGNSQLVLENNNGENYLAANEDGDVHLYYDGAVKISTKSDGANVVGELECDSLDVDGGFDIDGGKIFYDASADNLHFGDNVQLRIGTSSDFQIYHDGSASYIADNGTGNLNVQTNGAAIVLTKGSSENLAKFIADGAVELYHDNSKKLETTSSGASVTGNLGIGVASPFGKLQVKAGTDANFLHTTASSEASLEIINDAGSANVPLNVRASEYKVKVGSSEKLRIDSSGRILQGLTSAKTGFFNDSNAAPVHQIQGSTYYTTAFSIFRDGSGSSGPNFILAKGREAIVQDGDILGTLSFQGHDGTTELVEGAQIQARVDGTPGSNDMPSRLMFLTTADGASLPTERMRIRSNGRIGFNTAIPPRDYCFHSGQADTNIQITNNTTGVDDSAGSLIQQDGNNLYIWNKENGFFSFGTNASERMRINAAGNVGMGVGVTDPQAALHVENSNTHSSTYYLNTDAALLVHNAESGNGGLSVIKLEGTAAFVYGSGSSTLRFSDRQNERMRLDVSGHLMIGTTTFNVGDNNTSTGCSFAPTGKYFFSCANDGGHMNRNSNGYVLHTRNNKNHVGGITVNSNSTAYNTSSDYRLKENVVDLDGAIDRVKQFAPKRFNFISEPNQTVDGFLAHEAQTVVPEAVFGTHNEVDADGNPVMQGIDQAKLVPLLTAALQEAIAKIETLETKVAALEAAE